MFKLLCLMALVLVAVTCAPAPIPPPLYNPLAYSHSYVKVLPVHPPYVPLTYHQGYKWLHPGSLYLY